MSTTLSMTSRRMSTMEHAAVAVGALLVGVLLSAVLSGVAVGWVGVWTAVTYPIAVYASSRILEDRRQATDRLVRVVVTLAFIVVVLPLASLVWTVIVEGAARFDTTFLSGNMRLTLDDIASQRTGGEVGGAFHAMIGTLIVTAVSTVIAIPLGLFTAIYLVEYGRGRLAKAITSMVDVMTGIPSIVAGLFAYALFVLILGPGTRTGLAGGVALSVLMTPVVIRSAEEMLRLVPDRKSVV